MSEEKDISASQAAEATSAIATVEAAEAAPAPKCPRAHKRLWAIATLLCVVAIAAGTYLTYTAYKAGDFLKAVAATGTTQALFTSDLLNEYTTVDASAASRSIIVDSSGDRCSFTFRIYNCLLDNRNVFNSKDVNAKLSVTATSAGNDWTVSEGSVDITASAQAGAYGLPFPGYTATIKTFTITFNKQYLDQAQFTIKALVDTSSSPGTNLAMLGATIVPNRRADVAKATVRGDWLDQNGENVASFDAYNYRVTVTGKSTKVRLSWGEGVELDPFFATNHAGAQVDTAKRTATFDMEPGSQIINFFRADGSTAPANWEDMDVTVSSEETS